MSKIKITFEADSVEEAQKILKVLNFTSSEPSLPVIPPAIENKFTGGPIDVPTLPAPSVPVLSPANFIPSHNIETPSAEVDATGLSWDERIHSSTKSQTAKGAWVKRRGVGEDTVRKIENELRNAAPVTASVIVSNTPQTFRAGDNIAPPTPPAVPAANTFQSLMNVISGLFANHAISADYMKTLMSNIGIGFKTTINAITDIAARQDMIDYAFVLLKHDGKIA